MDAKIEFPKLHDIVEFQLKNLNLVRTSDIQIYPEYPSGFVAYAGIYRDMVFVLRSYYGHYHKDFMHCHGFMSGGAMIVKDCINNPFALCSRLDRDLANKLLRIKTYDIMLRT